MGAGGEKKSMRETDFTRAADKEMIFDRILEKVKAGGGEILRDETTALYTEVGNQEMEVGHQRVAEFNTNRIDFQLTQTVETHILQGSGHQKHLVELDTPRSRITMKQKPDNSQDWQVVDLEDMF